MSFFGDLVSKALPFAGMIPGVGPVIQGVEGLLHLGGGQQDGGTFNPSQGPSVGVTGDGTNPGISVPTDYGVDPSQQGGGLIQGVESFLKSHAGGVGNALGSVGSLLTGNGGINALGAAEGVNAAMQQRQANNYAKSALGGVQQSYNERAPLRTAGIQGLLNPQTPSIQGLSSIAGRNPFASGAPAPGPISPNQQMTMGMPNPALAPVQNASAPRVG